jgi:hypothetical protein
MKRKYIYYYVLEEHKSKIESQTTFKPEICYQILSNCSSTTRSMDGYVSVPQTKLKSITSNYSNYINYMCTNSMLYVDNDYTYITDANKEAKTKSYKLREVRHSQIAKIEAYNNEYISERIQYFNKIKNDKINTSRKDHFHQMKNNFVSFLKELPIDDIIEDAQNIQDVNDRMAQFILLDKIKNNNFYFKRNRTNNRLDSNLTNLFGNIKFYNYNNYTSIDISNSQPFFLYTLINILFNNLPYYVAENGCNYNVYQIVNSSIFKYNITNIDENELDKLRKWTISGKFYDNFVTIGTTRAEIKDMMFCVLFSKPSSYTKEKELFNKHFPTIAEFINDFKINNWYKNLSILLQRIEARIVLDVICPLMVKAGIFLVTIHDSWIVKTEDVNRAVEIIYSVFDVKPHLKLESFDELRGQKIYEFKNNIRKLKNKHKKSKFVNPMILLKKRDKKRYINLLKFPKEKIGQY